MKSVKIGYPEFLLIGGVALYISAPTTLAISIISISLISAVLRASLNINYLNKEEERRAAETELRHRSEERVDNVINQLVKAQQFEQAAQYTNIMNGRFDGGDDDDGNSGGFH